MSADRPRAALAANIERGRTAFNSGRYFRAHELWEEAWLELRGLSEPHGLARTVVQGLIQIAAGCHHLENGRHAAGRRLMEKGLAKLAAAPPLASAAPGMTTPVTPSPPGSPSPAGALLSTLDLPSFAAAVKTLLSNETTPTPGDLRL